MIWDSMDVIGDCQGIISGGMCVICDCLVRGLVGLGVIWGSIDVICDCQGIIWGGLCVIWDWLVCDLRLRLDYAWTASHAQGLRMLDVICDSRGGVYDCWM